MEQQKIDGGISTLDTGEALGSAVALSSDGNTALIGAPGANGCLGVPRGAAYVYERTGSVWVERGFLSINDDCIKDGPRTFESVALSADGKVALLGRPRTFNDNIAAGHAYVYVRNAKGKWVPQPPFTEDEAGNDEGSPIVSSGGEPRFGRSVALSGDGRMMLIGENDFFTGSGSVYVFKRAGIKWTELQKIVPPTGVEFDQIALAADGKTALIGAPDSLQAYVFVRGALQQVLSGPVVDQAFGASVSITADGKRLLVGAPGVDDASGATYLFHKSGDTWKLRQTLAASDPPQKGFGESVAISKNGSATLVGSPTPSSCPPGEFCPPEPCGEGLACGAAYVFRK